MPIKLFLLYIVTQYYVLSAETLDSLASQSDDFTSWIALFGLGLISLFALFLSSEQLRSYKEKQRERETLLDNEHQKEGQLLSKMGESIYDIAKESANNSHIAKSENQLLAITTNLIDFLRIKSKKVTIDNQKLQLSNLLNDVAGTLKSNIKNRNFELFYEIDTNIDKELDSDTLNMSKVLINIFLYCVENGSSQLKLHIGKTSLNTHDDQLSFTISTDLQIDAESDIDIFHFNYNETTEEYDSLGLFIAKELSSLMQGELIARNREDKNLEFVFSIPYSQIDSDEEKEDAEIERKNILLIDSSTQSAANIERLLLNLGHNVKVIDKSIYTDYFKYFDIYDIIFLDEKLFTNKTMQLLQNLSSKTVALSNLFQAKEEFPNSNIADLKISKPLTTWHLSSVIQQLYIDEHDTSKITKDGVVNAGTNLVHRNSFQDTRNVTLGSFSKFSDTRVLLVEDNIINQKVFVGVLGKSKMHISIAKHGKEALAILAENRNFDLIFMDINMPVMDGYTASIKIRENTLYDHIPIIALSALTSSDEIARMFTSGMNGYISKPLLKEKLFTALSIFVERSKHTAEHEIDEESTQTLELEGLNIAIGIAKSSANEIFYKEILTEFRDAYGETDKLFEKFIHDFRYEQLRIVCLDIRGLTGTIGALKLNATVTDILKHLSLKKHEHILELVKQYSIELRIVNNSISKYLESSV